MAMAHERACSQLAEGLRLSDPAAVASIIVSGVTSGAVVTALYFSSREVRILRRQLALETDQVEQGLVSQKAANDLELMGFTMALDRLFVEFPQLRRYFYEEVEVPTEEPLRSQVISTAELIIDLADGVISMSRHGQLDPEDREAWAAALSSYGRSFPVQMLIQEYEGQGIWRNATLEALSSAPIDSPAA